MNGEGARSRIERVRSASTFASNVLVNDNFDGGPVNLGTLLDVIRSPRILSIGARATYIIGSSLEGGAERELALG